MSELGDAARAIEVLRVHKGEVEVGVLARTTTGASFSYLPAYASGGDAPERRVALGMAVRAEPYEVRGVNLHPYFAGLLPEGLRLTALVRRTKTSSDDLFTLLAAAGRDAVGDVWVTPHSAESKSESSPSERASPVDPREIPRASFTELLAQHLELGEPIAIAGAMPKVSAARLAVPLRGAASGKQYLLKLGPPEFPRLVENEAFFMGVARAIGIETAKVRLVHDATGAAGLLVERFDRRPRAARSPGEPRSEPLERLHQEDAVQLLERYPADKYRLKIRDVMEVLECTSAQLVERLRLLERLAFAYLIADGDLHGKNISILVRDGRIGLSPAYDVLTTLPYGDHRQALAIEGKDANLRRAHFVALGERHGLRPAAVEHMLDRLTQRLARHIPRLPEIGLAERKMQHLERTITERLQHLSALPA